MSAIWSQQEIDVMLNAALNINSVRRSPSTCEAIGRSINKSQEAVGSMIWKLGAGYQKHAEYKPGPLRMSREGLEFTWMEKQVLMYAKVAKIPLMQICAVLMRHPEEVSAYIQKQESKGRGKGFQVFK
jgi:hypothetical protein